MLTLIALLLAKHWLADFPWQSQWMVVNKGNPRSSALFVHAAVHVACSAVVLLAASVPACASQVALVLLMEFCAHTVIDFVKAHKRLGGRWRIDQPRFWTILGLDQLAHHLTYVMMVWLLGT